MYIGGRDHRITDLKLKVDLHPNIVYESVCHLVVVSLTEAFPVLPHGQVVDLELELRNLQQVQLHVGSVGHVEGLHDTLLGVDYVHILSL